jgi:hypothetical protein
MKVYKALEMLSSYNLNDDIVIAWWDLEGMNGRVTPEQWSDIADMIDEQLDYECFHEASDFIYGMVDDVESENK